MGGVEGLGGGVYGVDGCGEGLVVDEIARLGLHGVVHRLEQLELEFRDEKKAEWPTCMLLSLPLGRLVLYLLPAPVASAMLSVVTRATSVLSREAK